MKRQRRGEWCTEAWPESAVREKENQDQERGEGGVAGDD